MVHAVSNPLWFLLGLQQLPGGSGSSGKTSCLPRGWESSSNSEWKGVSATREKQRVQIQDVSFKSWLSVEEGSADHETIRKERMKTLKETLLHLGGTPQRWQTGTVMRAQLDRRSQ